MLPHDNARNPLDGSQHTEVSVSAENVVSPVKFTRPNFLSRRTLLTLIFASVIGMVNVVVFFRRKTPKLESTTISVAGPFKDSKTIRLPPEESKIVSPKFLRLSTAGGHALIQLGFMFKGSNSRAPRRLVDVDLIDSQGRSIAHGSVVSKDLRQTKGFVHLVGQKLYRTGENTENIPLGNVDIASVESIRIRFSEHP